MKKYFEALTILFNSVSNINIHFKCENKLLIDSFNSISNKSIYSNLNIPEFNNSAMDGYAFYNHNKENLNYIKLNILTSITAGEFFEIDYLDFDFTIEIMTGARLPNVFNSIVKIEDVCIINKNIKEIVFKNNIKLYENIKFSGDDFKNGFLILEKGEVIFPSHFLLLSSLGINKINVITKPKIYILCTGNEIYNINYKDYIKNTFVYDSSSIYVINFLKLLKFEVYNLNIIKDKFNDFFKATEFIFLSNFLSIILTIGAISKGILDFIPKSFNIIGGNHLCHGIKIKPGKPILIGKIGKHFYYFCLPGNPISSIIGVRFFVYPFLRFILGLSFEKPIKALLTTNYKNIKKNDLFLKSFCYFENSVFYVKILNSQESFKISPILESNCFVFLKINDNSNINDLLDIFFYNPHYL